MKYDSKNSRLRYLLPPTQPHPQPPTLTPSTPTTPAAGPDPAGRPRRWPGRSACSRWVTTCPVRFLRLYRPDPQLYRDRSSTFFPN